MTEVLGLPVKLARGILSREGCDVIEKNTASRKGVDGSDDRVIRARLLPDGRVELVCSIFKTECE